MTVQFETTVTTVSFDSTADPATFEATTTTSTFGETTTPGPHASAHESGGSDPVSAAGIGAVPASLVDAKGDLLVGTAADTVGRLAVGADGLALVADSAEAAGLKFAAPAPAAHAPSHADGGSDEITVSQDQVTGLGVALAGKSPNAVLWLPGTSGNSVSCPDSAALDITGDLDLRVRIAMDDWTPASVSFLVYKWATSNFSYNFRIDTDGKLRLTWSTDGTSSANQASTVATGFTDGDAKWLRAVLDVDDGGVYKVYFHTAADSATEPSSWTQLGTTLTGGATTSIFSGTASLQVAVDPTRGKLYRAIVRNGIDGTVVADWAARFPAARYRDAYSNIWTVNGTANGWMDA